MDVADWLVVAGGAVGVIFFVVVVVGILEIVQLLRRIVDLLERRG